MSFKNGKLALATLALSLTICTATVEAQSENLISNQAQARADLDSQVQKAVAEITAAEQSGRISAAERSNLQTEVSSLQVKINEYAATGGGFTNSEMRESFAAINQLVSHISRGARNDGTVSTPGYGRGRGLLANQAQARADFDSRTANIVSEIRAGEQSGQISAAESSPLLTRVSSIQVMVNTFAASDGGLTNSEMREAFAALDDLASQVHRARRNRATNSPAAGSTDFTARVAELRTKISAEVAAGRLSRREARQLSQHLSHAESQYSRFAVNGLNRRESNQLDIALKFVSRRLDSMKRY